jgi:hypothetical protein
VHRSVGAADTGYGILDTLNFTAAAQKTLSHIKRGAERSVWRYGRGYCFFGTWGSAYYNVFHKSFWLNDKIITPKYIILHEFCQYEKSIRTNRVPAAVFADAATFVYNLLHFIFIFLFSVIAATMR